MRMLLLFGVLVSSVGLPSFARAAETGTVEVTRTIVTSEWSPPSPDPMGLTWDRAARRLLVVDSEVEETARWRGVNLFRMTRRGRATDGSSLMAFTDEPTDIVHVPGTGRYFVSSDGPDRVYEVFPGKDARAFTGDDRVSEINLLRFAFEKDKARDIEGLAFGAGSLWLVDEAGAEMFRLRPGRDARWSGRAQRDNIMVHWDTAGGDQPIPEGVEFAPRSGTLLVVSNRPNSDISEFTKRGKLVAVYDGSAVGSHSPSGLRWAPSVGRGKSLYMTDRGIDNDRRPNENDGRIFELRLSS